MEDYERIEEREDCHIYEEYNEEVRKELDLLLTKDSLKVGAKYY